MAFTDVTNKSRVIQEGVGKVKITLAGAVVVGDLIGYSAGWKQADGNNSIFAELVAGSNGADTEVITAYKAARISGITTGTAGNPIYLSDTAGAYSASAGTVEQTVGVELGGGEIWVEPKLEAIPGLIGNPVTHYATLTVGVDDTGYDFKLFGATASSHLLWDESDDALEVVGVARVDFSGCTVAAANTDGGIMKGGTSSAKIIEDTANMKFMSFYFDDGASSGSAEGLYVRLYGTGTLGTAQAARFFTTVDNVVVGTARGAHISLNFNTSGTITGLGSALTTTLHIPNSAAQTGTLTSHNVEIWSDGSTSDPAGATSLSYFRISNGGNATGAQDVDTDAVLFEFNGSSHTAGSGSLLDTTASAATGDATIKIRWSDGTTKYLLVADDPN